MVGVPRTVIAASSTSPFTVPVGLARTRLLPPVLAAAAEPRYNPTGPSGAFWLRVLNRLSRTYRERGLADQAAAIDARLRRLLVLADADHPLVLQLARRSRAGALSTR